MSIDKEVNYTVHVLCPGAEESAPRGLGFRGDTGYTTLYDVGAGHVGRVISGREGGREGWAKGTGEGGSAASLREAGAAAPKAGTQGMRRCVTSAQVSHVGKVTFEREGEATVMHLCTTHCEFTFFTLFGCIAHFPSLLNLNLKLCVRFVFSIPFCRWRCRRR